MSIVLKCALKPIDPRDYLQPFDAAEMGVLRATFPTGVCDYTRPGIEQQPLKEGWLSFGPAGRPAPTSKSLATP